MNSLPGRLNVVELLLKSGADINLKNDAGQTPIYTSTFEGDPLPMQSLKFAYIQSIAGHERVVETLIKNGADINLRERDGWAPINVAAHKDYERIAEMLLKNGANPNNQNNQGSTPLFTASNFGLLIFINLLL